MKSNLINFQNPITAMVESIEQVLKESGKDECSVMLKKQSMVKYSKNLSQLKMKHEYINKAMFGPWN